MKLFTIFMLILAVGPTVFVSAEVMVRTIFNNGRAPSSWENTYCTSTETSLIDQLFDLKKLLGRRQLRTSSAEVSASPTSTSSANTTNTTGSRELYIRKCKDYCKGVAAGTCRATNCVGYRRRDLKENSNGGHDERELQTGQCPAVVDVLNAALDAVQVSPSCRNYLDKSKRTTECFDDVVYGEIEGVRLWRVSFLWSSVLQERMPSSGYSFCKSTLFTFESINNDCVDNVSMVLEGPNNYRYTNTRSYAPFTLFNDLLGLTMIGQRMYYAGNYTLSVTPDGFENKKRTFSFTLKNC